ncbi:MAG: uroporphyrinogen decarboxylase, partial [Planctomycetes bacterium]|nr:uroporphyrinogen decarboxylase [Planctomycetota bacterium]
MKSLDSTSPYMAAVRGVHSNRRPIWIMRQAGRYLPEYLAVREKHPFVEVCNTPELACEVTLQPIRRFGFDAAILFSDILVPLAPMGAAFYFGNGSPRLEKPLRDGQEIRALHTVDSREELAFVAQAIRLITSELGETPLIGFAGAPFTLAAYLVEGGGSQNYENLKTMLYKRADLLEH